MEVCDLPPKPMMIEFFKIIFIGFEHDVITFAESLLSAQLSPANTFEKNYALNHKNKMRLAEKIKC